MFHFFQVDSKNGFASLQIRKLRLYAAVETAGTEQCLDQTFRTVGSGQNYHTLPSVESVHLGQQLVECLLSFIVAHTGISPFAYRIYFIYENDARSLLASLFEQIPHLGGTHPDKHLDELRA